jgi:hypothetical protein
MVLDKGKQMALLLHYKCFNSYFAHVLYYQIIQPHVAVLLCIQKIPDSILNPETSYLYSCFHALPQSHQANSGIMPQIMPWPPSSTSFSIQNLLLMLLLDAGQSKLLTVLSNKP